MKDLFSNEHPSPLTPELSELDAELARLGIRERASFAPELEAELVRRWSEIESERASRSPARFVLVGTAAVLFLALVYSPARASLTRLVRALSPADTEQVVEVGPLETAIEPVVAQWTLVAPPVQPSAEADHSTTPLLEGAHVDAGDLTVFEPADFTFPRVTDPNSLQVLLEEHYPRHLQESRVGGKVRVRLWVDPSGSPSLVQVWASSGVPALDRAAREAATQLLFEPARWLGYPVGTWVEFDVGFDPTKAIA